MNKTYPQTKIGKNVSIGINVILGKDVEIEDGTKVRNNVVIYDNTKIGKNCLIEDGVVIGKPPVNSKAVFRKISDKNSPVIIGDNVTVGTNAVLYTDVRVGQDSLLGDGVNIREGCRVGERTLLARLVTVNYNTLIGNDCKICDLSHLTGNMIVEDNVFMGIGIDTSNDNDMGRNINVVHKGPVVKTGALIGGGACLLPGVVIGEYSVIGMGAVVTKDVPPQKIAKGIPAVWSDLPERFKSRKKI